MATYLGVPVVNSGKYYFISYNTEDAELVSRYLKSMVDKGLPVWYDYGIPQGEEWERIIAEKIYNCEDVIMFISNNVFKKDDSYVKKEWKIAKGRTKPKKVYIIVLDQIDEDNIPPCYAFWWNDIKDIQSIQAYTMELDACVDHILQSVGHKKKAADAPLLSLINDDFEIKSGVLKKYKGKDSIVTIPSGITSIGDEAFEGCETLTKIVIPNSVTSIGCNAFSGCISLNDIVIPDSVITIGSHAFRECSSLTRIVIPDSVTNIGWRTFEGCFSLACVVMSKNITMISSSTFCYCKSLNEILIPDSVTSIGNYVFWGCKSLAKVVIGNSVTTIGDRVFFGCDSLANIEVSEDNQYYKSINGNLYSKNGKTILRYAPAKQDTSFIIPDSVTSICDNSFSCCNSLTKITIPKGIKSIGDFAFSECEGLKIIKYLGSKTDWSKVKKSENWLSSSCDCKIIFRLF